MSDYEQLEIDTTLDHERSLKDNVRDVIDFAFRQIEYYEQPKDVVSHHEGYGILADQLQTLLGNTKATSKAMDDTLKCLSNGEGDFVQHCGYLYAQAASVAESAIKFAAHAQRILKNLTEGNLTPIEEYAEGLEDDPDGFETAEPIDSDETEENVAEEATENEEG